MPESSFTLIWFIGGAILMLLELVLPGGIAFFLGFSAFLVAVLAFYGLIHGWTQAFTFWFIGSLGMLLV